MLTYQRLFVSRTMRRTVWKASSKLLDSEHCAESSILRVVLKMFEVHCIFLSGISDVISSGCHTSGFKTNPWPAARHWLGAALQQASDHCIPIVSPLVVIGIPDMPMNFLVSNNISQEFLSSWSRFSYWFCQYTILCCLRNTSSCLMRTVSPRPLPWSFYWNHGTYWNISPKYVEFYPQFALNIPIVWSMLWWFIMVSGRRCRIVEPALHWTRGHGQVRMDADATGRSFWWPLVGVILS